MTSSETMAVTVAGRGLGEVRLRNERERATSKRARKSSIISVLI